MPYSYNVSCHVTPVVTIDGTPDISLNIVSDTSVNLIVTSMVEQTNAVTTTTVCRDTTTVNYTHTPTFTVRVNGTQPATVQGSTDSGSKTISGL
jgi:hypothetical protein